MPILYLPTREPPTVQPTANTQVQRELADLRARVAELEPERDTAPVRDLDAPEPIYQQASASQAAPTMPPPAEPSLQLQTLRVPEGKNR